MSLEQLHWLLALILQVSDLYFCLNYYSWYDDGHGECCLMCWLSVSSYNEPSFLVNRVSVTPEDPRMTACKTDMKLQLISACSHLSLKGITALLAFLLLLISSFSSLCSHANEKYSALL